MKKNNTIPFNEFKVGVKYINVNNEISTCVFKNDVAAIFENEKTKKILALDSNSYNTFEVYNENRLDEFKKFVVIYSPTLIGIAYLKSKSDYLGESSKLLTVEEAEKLGFKI